MDECDKVNPNLRDLCRCERSGQTLEQCNRRRLTFGVSPLLAMPGTEPPAATIEPKSLTAFEKIKSFASVTAQTVWRFVAYNEAMLSEKEMQARLDICNACPRLQDGHCSLCSCSCQKENRVKFLSKLAHRSSVCPDDPPRWGPMPQA